MFCKDLNVYISSFLNNKDILSLLQVNKNLFNDIGYIPHINFLFDYKTDDITLKKFLKYANYIKYIRVVNCDFFFSLTIDIPNLESIYIDEDNVSKIYIHKSYMQSKKLKLLTFSIKENKFRDAKNYLHSIYNLLEKFDKKYKKSSVTYTGNYFNSSIIYEIRF